MYERRTAMKICTIGAGYVGLTTSAVLADLGHNVICIDNNQKKIDHLREGKSPIYEPGLIELMKKNSKQLSFSTNIRDAIHQSSVIFIAVGTPSSSNGATDLSHIYSVIREISLSIDSYKTIVIKSTVPPGTSQNIIDILSKNVEATLFNVVMNPEFLREGSAIWDMLHPNKTVLGIAVHDNYSEKIMKEIYKGLDAPFIVTSLAGAEMIKYASNSFLAMKISFINEIARICESFQIDVTDVANGIGKDPRIGNLFLKAGLGYGGSCFPKDVRSLTYTAKTKNIDTPLLDAIQKINHTQVLFYLSKLKTILPTLSSKKVAVLGLSFKPHTDDTRDSQSIRIVDELLSHNCLINVYDPKAKVHIDGHKNLTQSEDIESTLLDSDCVILATEWDEFIKFDWKKGKELMRGNIVVDGRNCLDKEALQTLGFQYVGIGRG